MTNNWQVSKILTCGTIGEPTAASRRYQRRSWWAAVAFVGAMFVLRELPPEVPAIKYFAAFAPGLVFLYICAEFRRYLLSMDEMLRRIHLESIAWTYLTALVLAMFAGGIGSLMGYNISPMWFVLVEPVRAAWLYATARRY